MRRRILALGSLMMAALPCLAWGAEGAHGEAGGGGGLLEALGLEWQVLLIQALGFLIVLLILWKFAFGKIGTVLDARRENIQNRLQQLEADQQRLDELTAETQRRLDQIEAEAERKIQEAVEEANRERERILNEARAAAAQELENARRRIEQERDAAILELRSTVAELAVAAASKILNAELDETRHRQLIDDFIEAMPSQPPQD